MDIHSTSIRTAFYAALAMLAAFGLMFAFQGWVMHGPSILLTLMETGLSYCF
ncbi:hypothetical protein FE840_015435 [Peteryoungia desertarenae]|uniref:Uncharacterized protein n=1 Tax=Peteryoungia desertarenae TaxID=1813451 RepID=A0ABX6QQF5_9HYPH|nr:hypothetical protein [Peteryoungia desertarenae]QLF70821.1 hypothetical protein FE840_015435 [Peteryoungia desertarenae]